MNHQSWLAGEIAATGLEGAESFFWIDAVYRNQTWYWDSTDDEVNLDYL